MKRHNLLSMLLLGFFLLSLFPAFNFDVEQVYASANTLPSDGDAWTENDNSTYPWKFHTSYATNNTMNWITSDVKAGSYALNVTHGQSSTSMYFRVVFDQPYDLTSYDAIYLWMKPMSTDTTFECHLIMHSTDTNWDNANELEIAYDADPAVINDTWGFYCAPFQQFIKTGTANWSSVRQIYFRFTGLDSASGSQFLIDNLYFGTWELSAMTSPTTSMQTLMANTWHNFKESQYSTTYSGNNYTTQYDYQNLTTNVWTVGGLEIEVLGHSIYALCLAYNETEFDFYLNEANTLGNFALQFQEQQGVLKGFFHNSYDDAEQFTNTMSTTHNGWVMAGLSYLYGITLNSTYKTSLDLIREAQCGWNWNDTLNIWNGGGDNGTQTVTYSTSFSAMPQGATLAGMSLYYKYVSQNSTVLDRINKVETVGTTTLAWNRTSSVHASAWEDNAYFLTGIYWSYQATSNVTYKNHFINGTEILLSKMIQQPNLNGSAISAVGYPLQWQQDITNKIDGWGLHESLHLFYLMNKLQSGSYWVNALERSLFSHLYETQDDDGGFQRSTAVGWVDRQYDGSPAFVHMALQLYNLAKSTEPYIIGSTALTSTVSSSTNTLSFTLTDTGTSTTYVYCGTKGEPTTVSGATSWSYDENSKICTLSLTHASSKTVTVDWSPSQASGLYELKVHVQNNGLGLAGVTVDITGIGGTMLSGDIESKVTDSSGKVSWQLPYGVYAVRATIEEDVKSMTVWLNSDRDVGFDFSKPSIDYSPLKWLFVPIFLLILGFFVLPKIMRRR